MAAIGLIFAAARVAAEGGAEVTIFGGTFKTGSTATLAILAGVGLLGFSLFKLAETRPPKPNGQGDTSYKPFKRSNGYATRVPTGPEWSTKPEYKLSSGLYRTSLYGPRGVEIWIDYTPHEKARFSREGRAIQERRTIDHPEFGLADEVVFRGGLPRCESVPCVDYLMNDGATGYAVLGGGGDYATARSAARKVALELKPR